jgi:kynurenine formamidase
MSRQAPPSRDEVLAYFGSLSNWGRWGADDELGTLNLITPAHRVHAAGLVREGVVVPLGMDLDPDEPDPLKRGTRIELEPITYAMGRMTAAREVLTLTPHGSLTHIDSLAHIGWDGRFYNGFTADEVLGPRGVQRLSVHQAKDGIVTRGVLLDIAAVRGVDWLEDGDGIYPEDLLAAEELQGVRVGEGDVLLARTGYLRRALPDHDASADTSHTDSHYGGVGYHVSTLPLLHERGVAVIGSDALNDMNPSGYALDGPATPDKFDKLDTEVASLAFPVHAVALSAMGAWLLDHVVLEQLTETCRRLGRWDFLLAMEPLRMVGSSGSHVNPLALF